jgi:hypothetical protein
MTWAYSDAGESMERPSAERGIYIRGPLSVADMTLILQAIVEEIVEQAKRERDAEGT